jgi:competence transcription factor ComK
MIPFGPRRERSLFGRIQNLFVLAQIIDSVTFYTSSTIVDITGTERLTGIIWFRVDWLKPLLNTERSETQTLSETVLLI